MEMARVLQAKSYQKTVLGHSGVRWMPFCNHSGAKLWRIEASHVARGEMALKIQGLRTSCDSFRRWIKCERSRRRFRIYWVTALGRLFVVLNVQARASLFQPICEFVRSYAARLMTPPFSETTIQFIAVY